MRILKEIMSYLSIIPLNMEDVVSKIRLGLGVQKPPEYLADKLVLELDHLFDMGETLSLDAKVKDPLTLRDVPIKLDFTSATGEVICCSRECSKGFVVSSLNDTLPVIMMLSAGQHDLLELCKLMRNLSPIMTSIGGFKNDFPVKVYMEVTLGSRFDNRTFKMQYVSYYKIIPIYNQTVDYSNATLH